MNFASSASGNASVGVRSRWLWGSCASLWRGRTRILRQHRRIDRGTATHQDEADGCPPIPCDPAKHRMQKRERQGLHGDPRRPPRWWPFARVRYDLLRWVPGAGLLASTSS
jgi:hypothetical protein